MVLTYLKYFLPKFVSEREESNPGRKAGEINIYLLGSYFKGEKTEITKKKIENLLKKLNLELA